MKIESISLTVVLDDGEKVDVLFTENGIQRWGNETSVIAETVDATEEMWRAARGYMLSDQDDDRCAA